MTHPSSRTLYRICRRPFPGEPITGTYPCSNISFPVFRLINTLKEIKQNQDQEAITVTGKLNVFITFLIKIIIDSEFSFPE